MATLSSILAGEFHGQRSLAGSVHGVAKSQVRLSNYHSHMLMNISPQLMPYTYPLSPKGTVLRVKEHTNHNYTKTPGTFLDKSGNNTLAISVSRLSTGWLWSKWVIVAQLCPTLCVPMDYSLPGFSVHGILQARILEWFAIFFSRGSSRPRDQRSPVLQANSLPSEPPGKPTFKRHF